MANNNYYDGQNTNPGFNTANTIPGQQGGMAIGGGGFDLGQWLNSLNVPQQSGNSQGGMALGGSPQNSQQNGAYQKGVQKALQESGYKHATEALTAGMPADQIQNHPLMAPQQPQQKQVNPQAMAVLQQLVQAKQNPQQQPSMQQPQALPGANIAQGQNQPSSPQDQINDNVMKQLLSSSQQPQGFLDRFGQNVRDLSGLSATKLGNLGKTQELAAGQPSNIAVPTAQAANLNAQAEYQKLTNSGNKPIDPDQYLTAYSGMYQKAYDAYGKDEESGNQITQSALDQYNKIADQSRNAIQKGLGSTTPDMQKTLQAAGASLKASIDARTNFHNFMMNNSPAQVIGGIQNKINGNNNMPNPAQAMSMKIKGAIGYDTDKGIWVDANGKAVN